MMNRDLLLQNAASFGSFHLIRLLYDEYLFILIVHRCAKVTGRTPIAVMSEVWFRNLYLSSTNFDLIHNQETFQEWNNLLITIQILISFILKLGGGCF